ncbi:MAG: hypothetical protein JKY48_13810, partial [Flavobacteriales bacterium]|nr:hypothetical protein [Flavobacteriales bacterium]
SGRTTFYSYDGFGRARSKINPNGVKTSYNLGWDIGPGGGTGTTVVNNAIYTSTETTLGKPLKKAWYDNYGRERKREIDGMNQKVYKVTSYDSRGNIKTSTAPFFLGSANIVLTTNTYDDKNRLISVASPAGTSTILHSESQSQTTSVVSSPNIASKSKTIDATGKIISVVDQGQGTTINYTYYASGLRKEMKLGGTTVASMQYDILGSQTQLIDKNAGTTNYTYDVYGNLLTQSDSKGLSSLNYNNFNQLISKTNPIGTTTYEYYTSGGGINKVKSISHSNGSKEDLFYDKYGREVKYEKTVSNEKFTYKYDFDRFDRILTKEYPSGFKIINEYSPHGHIKKITDFSNNSPIWVATAMNSYGKYTSVTKGNNQISSYLYDKYGLLKEINGELDYDFEFDPTTGNLMKRTDHNHGSIFEDFEYDNMDRLKKMTVNNTVLQSINFQSNGNITKKGGITQYNYSVGKPNAVTSVLDANSIMPQEEQNITYNAIHQPSLISQGNFDLEFEYGSDGQRITSRLKENGTLKRTRFYLPDYEKQTFTANNKEQLIHYISGGDGLAAMYVIEDGVGSMYYTYTDYLGSILKVTDANGNTIAEQNSDAWGRRRSATDWSYSSTSSIPDWLYRGYTGHEHHDEFVLINMNGRLYDATLGRMLSPDNYIQDNTNTQNFNRFSYALNNPLKFTDPNGESLILAAIIIGAIVGAYIGGAAANGWEFNPVKWDWRSGDTWTGIITGAVIGAAAGYGFAVAAPALANTAIFAHFGASGTLAAYTITGAVAGGLAGYASGFVGGLVHSNWDLEYARNSGEIGAQIGASLGGLGGGIAGIAEGYKPIKPVPPVVFSSSPYSGGGPLIASNDPNFTGGSTSSGGDDWFIDISDPLKYPGIKIYQTSLIANGSAITLPYMGIFIHSSYSGIDLTQLIQHEYGHYLDFRFNFSMVTMPQTGTFFYPVIGLPSLFNTITGIGGDHRNFWTERRANRYAKGFFGDDYIDDPTYFPY